MTSVDI